MTAWRRRRAGARVAVVAAALALATACDGDAGSATTVEQGRAAAVAALQEAGAALPGATLTRQPDQDVPCRGLSSNGEERVTVGVTFLVEGVGDHAAAVEVLRERWASQGYDVADSSEPGRVVRVEQDGMRLAYAVAPGGTRLTAAVSCLRP